jgi:hypothetical protein
MESCPFGDDLPINISSGDFSIAMLVGGFCSARYMKIHIDQNQWIGGCQRNAEIRIPMD